MSILKKLKAMREERGAVLVEMAFVLPMFFALMFATMQFAMILFNYCNAAYACRIAARYGSLHSLQSENPATYSTISAIVSQNLLLPTGESAGISWCFNGQCNTSQAWAMNNVGSFTGVGILYSTHVWWGQTGNVYFTYTSYKAVTR